jgi:hypothetical protein
VSWGSDLPAFPWLSQTSTAAKEIPPIARLRLRRRRALQRGANYIQPSPLCWSVSPKEGRSPESPLPRCGAAPHPRSEGAMNWRLFIRIYWPGLVISLLLWGAIFAFLSWLGHFLHWT